VIKVRKVLTPMPSRVYGEAFGTPGYYEIPKHWEIWNAPRPMAGEVTWVGDFLTGNLYAAVDPDGPRAESWRAFNVRMDGRRLQFIQKADAVAAFEQIMAEEYGAEAFASVGQREIDAMFEDWWAERREVEVEA
jgi:hypothetical protein